MFEWSAEQFHPLGNRWLGTALAKVAKPTRRHNMDPEGVAEVVELDPLVESRKTIAALERETKQLKVDKKQVIMGSLAALCVTVAGFIAYWAWTTMEETWSRVKTVLGLLSVVAALCCVSKLTA